MTYRYAQIDTIGRVISDSHLTTEVISGDQPLKV